MEEEQKKPDSCCKIFAKVLAALAGVWVIVKAIVQPFVEAKGPGGIAQ